LRHQVNVVNDDSPSLLYTHWLSHRPALAYYRRLQVVNFCSTNAQ